MARIIAGEAHPEAEIIFGATIDDAMTDQIKITVIGTGFEPGMGKLFRELEEEEAENSTVEADADDEYDIPAFLRKK